MICIDHVSKEIRRTRVLDDITMTMEPGRITGLAGPNGSGKTMLMRAIVGLIRPTAGTVTVGGRDPWRRSVGGGSGKDAGPSIGMLLEGPAFLDAYTGMGNLRLLASIRGVVGEEEMRAAIAAMGLDPDDKRKYRAYSLGMKQRLGIAGAVMERPDILIVDEPTNALDASGVELAIAQIRAAAERGATVVLACHDADVLRGLSDEIWYLAEGHIDGHEVLNEGPHGRDGLPGAGEGR